MGLERFIDCRRVVHRDHGGRCFTCRAPSVATVHLVLGLYGREILAAREALGDEDDGGAVLHAAVGQLAQQQDERLLRVLETCVDEPVGWFAPLEALAGSVLSLTDLPAIAEALNLPKLDDAAGDAPSEEDDDTVSWQSQAVMKLATACGCSPCDVMRWPYLAFIEAMRAMNALDEARAAAFNEATRRPSGGLDVATADLGGLGGVSTSSARRGIG